LQRSASWNVTLFVWRRGLCCAGGERSNGRDAACPAHPRGARRCGSPRSGPLHTRFFSPHTVWASRRNNRDGSRCDASCVVSERMVSLRSWAAVRASGKHGGSTFFSCLRRVRLPQLVPAMRQREQHGAGVADARRHLVLLAWHRRVGAPCVSGQLRHVWRPDVRGQLLHDGLRAQRGV
jgi:hypothetical protein